VNLERCVVDQGFLLTLCVVSEPEFSINKVQGEEDSRTPSPRGAGSRKIR